MSTIVKIILGILSYIISLEVTHITHQKFIKLLADSGYTIKNGDKLSLYEEIDAPTNYISKVMLFIPYVNILASCYESVITINALEYIIEELLDMDIITPLTIEEINYYESHNKLHSFPSRLETHLQSTHSLSSKALWSARTDNITITNIFIKLCFIF